jgi:ABC-type sugar transport system ATPase subunit
MKNEKPILTCTKFDKHFGATHAVNNVSFFLNRGDIFGLVGENGAGKSTLIKMIGGECIPDSGKMIYKNSEVKWKKSSDALNNKISIVHQEPLLISSLNGADNIFLNKEHTKGVIIDEEETLKKAKLLLQKYPIYPDLILDKNVDELMLDEKFIVEILKALSYEPDILILDEPTASLPKKSSERLLNLLEELSKKEKKTFIYISHKLEEAIKVCNKIMVLRNGENVGILEKEDIEENKLIKMMINQDYEHFYPKKSENIGNTILQVKNLNTEALKNINIEIKAGEIVGLYGLMGAGMNEIALSIFGINNDLKEGTISLHGKKMHKVEVSSMIKKGVFLIPPDKHKYGLFDTFTVAGNITIAHLYEISPQFLISKSKENKIAEKQAAKFNIKYGNIGQLVEELSGGNQQKIILARWLFKECEVLILVDPTVGIDIGAKREIYNLLRDLTKKNKGILMVSSEINEIVGISDKIYTMRRGRITAELEKEQITQENILKNIL